MIVSLLRKPLSSNTLCSLPCGVLHIDASRTPTAPWDAKAMERVNSPGSGRNRATHGGRETPEGRWDGPIGTGVMDTTKGRFPANLIVSRLVASILDTQSGFSRNAGKPIARSTKDESTGWHMRQDTTGIRHADSGGASRYFKVVQ